MALNPKTIKERIKLILDNDDRVDVRNIVNGVPYINKVKTAPVTPVIYITTHNNLDWLKPFGATGGNRFEKFEHEMRFMVIAVVRNATGERAEAEIDDLMFNIQSVLEENNTLSFGAQASLVQQIYPEAINTAEVGNDKLSRILTLKAVAVDD